MKVILLKDYSSLGEDGDIIEVRGGYGRNFLIPQKIATLYTEQSLSILNSRKHKIENIKKEKKRNSLDNKSKIEKMIIEFDMQSSETGKLFGSVTPQVISEKLEENGIVLNKKSIEIPKNHIRSVGDYKIKIRLYDGDSVDLKIKITSKSKDLKEETK